MKLAHPDLKNQIVFTENIVNVVTVENKAFFTNLIQDLIYQSEDIEGEFVLSEKNAEMEISKTCELVIDPFNLDVNNKKNLNKIYATLKSISVDENNYVQTAGLKSSILSYIDNLLFQSDVPLTCEDDFDIANILRAINVKIESEYSSLLEKIIYYISVIKELSKIDCFIFVNLKQFIAYSELQKLYTFTAYNKINLLLLEGVFCDQTHPCEKHYIIDTDLCEIF